nr:AI-2E family transporter [Sedimentibacter sp.]
MKNRNFFILIPAFIIYVIIFRFLYLENGLSTIIKICLPIFLGLFIAVLLNPILIFIEHKVKIKSRGLSILITYTIFFGIIVIIIIVIAPSIIGSLSQLLKDIPKLFLTSNRLISNFVENYGILGGTESFYFTLQEYLFNFVQKFTSILTLFINMAISHVIDIFAAIWDLILAIIISVYILMDKENFENWFYKLCHSLFEKKYADDIVYIGYSLNRNVTSFIFGKFLDSLLVGFIAFLGSKYIINSRYPIIDGIIIGITNIIPYFGSFIGGIPVTVITLLYNPTKGFLMAIFILVLQQFDGMVLGPKIIGVRLSIKPIIIIISIIIGGGLFGVIGMFLATPVVALIKTSIDAYMEIKLKNKNIQLPHKNF